MRVAAREKPRVVQGDLRHDLAALAADGTLAEISAEFFGEDVSQ